MDRILLENPVHIKRNIALSQIGEIEPEVYEFLERLSKSTIPAWAALGMWLNELFFDALSRDLEKG